MLRQFTAQSVLIVFILGGLCAALSRSGAFLSSQGFANTSVPVGCAGKIPLLPGTKSQRSGVVCTSDQLFNVLSGGFVPAQAHDFFKVAQLALGIVPVEGPDEIASLKYLFHASSLTYLLHKVPIHLFNLVLTV
jgi:hypothetical protein